MLRKIVENLKMSESLYYSDKSLFGKMVIYSGNIYKVIEANVAGDDLLVAIKSLDNTEAKGFLNPNMSNFEVVELNNFEDLFIVIRDLYNSEGRRTGGSPILIDNGEIDLENFEVKNSNMTKRIIDEECPGFIEQLADDLSNKKVMVIGHYSEKFSNETLKSIKNITKIYNKKAKASLKKCGNGFILIIEE